MHPSGLDIFSPRRPSKDVIFKICPNSSDIRIAREFLISIGAHHYVMLPDFCEGLENVVDWMQVKSCILCRRNWHLKARQTNPDSPPGLIRRYQVVVNVLKHYSLSPHARPAIRNDNSFFRDLYRAPRFSNVNSWTNAKKLLKRRT